MPEKKKWTKKVVKRPGALSAKATQKGSKYPERTKQQARLVKTLAKIKSL